MWIIQQGQQQGVKFDTGLIKQNGWNIVSSPILHDKSANNNIPADAPGLGDREFIYGGGKRVKQGAAVIGGNTTTWAKGLVNYYSASCGPDYAPAVGLVDMKKYSAWLVSQGIPIVYEIPKSTRLCN
jgi:hypothetical protein